MSLVDRVRATSAAIFEYHCRRPMISGIRKAPFGNYASVSFRRAGKSPLALLLKECRIVDELNRIELLKKESPDQCIDDTDLESVILSVRNESDTLFILVTAGDVPSDDYARLFRAFTRHIAIILPLGEKEIVRLEKWVSKRNFNACLVYLVMLADRITSEGEVVSRGLYANRAKWQAEATHARLDRMAKLRGPQLRTLIKKLSFLLSFEKAGSEITEACKYIKISRKTFYLWRQNDPVFRRLLSVKG